MSPHDKPLAWLHGHVKIPPFKREARVDARFLLRRVQQGDKLGFAHSRPIPSVGARCHELRINDVDNTWRIVYRIDVDAIVILEVFPKKTGKTPNAIIDICKQRLKYYDSD